MLTRDSWPVFWIGMALAVVGYLQFADAPPTEWTYKDCEGNTHAWSRTYNFLYSADFFAPADEENHVTCLAYAVAPVPQALTDFCGQGVKVTGPTVTEDIAPGGCTGWRIRSRFMIRRASDCWG